MKLAHAAFAAALLAFQGLAPATLQAQQIDPQSIVKPGRMNKAMELYRLGPTKSGELIELLGEETAEFPENIEAWMMLGMTHYGLGNHAEAIDPFARALELMPEDDPRIVLLYAESLFQLKRYDEARAALDSHREDIAASPRLARGLQKLDDALHVADRSATLNQAIELFAAKGFNPQLPYVFLVVDQENLDVAAKDRDFLPFLRPVAGKRWRSVLAMPNAKNVFAIFGVHYVDDEPQATFRLDQSPDIGERLRQITPEHLNSLLQPVNKWEISENPRPYRWTVLRVPTEAGDTLMGFQLAPDGVADAATESPAPAPAPAATP
jgi:tetratricopeptide (TPR) repeat protein